MACTQNATVTPCLEYSSATAQLRSLVLLLCQALKALNAETDCDFDTQLAAAEETGLTCLSVGQLRAKQAEAVCSGLDVDCDSLDCASLLELEAVRTRLVCSLINEINP